MKLLKEIYNQDFFDHLTASISKFYPEFDENKFTSLIYNKSWPNKELKEKMRHISLSLGNTLTKSYASNIDILKNAISDIDLPKDNMPGLSLIIFADYVEVFGMEDFKTSIHALEYFTEFASSEFAIRQFILKYEEKTLEILKQWSKNNNHHIRRLACEGCRPRLPWAISLPKYKNDPTPIIPILESLIDDSEEYVRRSVANNLNDISKDNPKIVLNLAKKWLTKDRERLVKHSLRTLLKSGNKEALELFGFDSDHGCQINTLAINNTQIKMGDDLEFNFELAVQKNNKVRIEYAMYFLRNNGNHSKKIFQITERFFSKGCFLFKKSHSFKKISTRKYYEGRQKIALILNGGEIIIKEFHLES